MTNVRAQKYIYMRTYARLHKVVVTSLRLRT